MPTEIRQIQVRRDTAANWTSSNPTLASGEIGYETDTGFFKIGNGSSAWTALTTYFKLLTAANMPSAVDAAKIADGSVSNTEFQRLNGVSADIQTQIDAKQATLVSATNIKSVNGSSLLGSGDLTVSGGVGGTVGTTDNVVPRADGTGGVTLQSSGVTIDDGNNLVVPGRINNSGSGNYYYNGDSAFGDVLGLGQAVIQYPSGSGIILRDNAGNRGFMVGGAAVASAASIQPTGTLFHVTGAVTITTILGTIGGFGMISGTEITMIFDSTATVTNGASIKLAGGVNFVATANDTLTLVWDGTAYFEKCRSIN
jgi:hypothetical protein